MAILGAALLGWLVGVILHWSADYLASLVHDETAPPRPPLRWPRPALALLAAGPARRAVAWQGLVVEGGLMVVWAALAAQWGLSWRWLPLAAATALYVLIAIVDWRYRLVPTKLVVPAMALSLLLHALPPGRDTVLALIGGVLGYGMFALAALLRPEGLGGGDVNLAGLMGLMFGFPLVLWALIIGTVSGGVAALILLLSRRGKMKTIIPYAPFLCLGAIVALLYNPIAALLHF